MCNSVFLRTDTICSKDVVFKRLKKFFEESDKDNDGQLTVKELTSTLRRYGYSGSDDEIRVRIIEAPPQDGGRIPTWLAWQDWSDALFCDNVYLKFRILLPSL